MNRQRRSALVAVGSAPIAAALSRTGMATTPSPVRIGYAVPESGPLAFHAEVAQQRATRLWVDQINAQGGLSVRGSQRPVQLVGYDDRGEFDLTTQLYLKLMTVDKVDLILAPFSSKSTFAVAPLANKYGYPMLAPTGISRKLLDMKLPYFFSLLQQSDRFMTALVDLMVDNGVRSIGVLYLDDLFGIESLAGLKLALRGKRIDVKALLPYSPDNPDLSAQVRAIRECNADAFVGLTYPDATFGAIEQSKKMAFNPKLFFTAVGTSLPHFRATMGQAAEHVMGMGTWNAKSSPAARAFSEAYLHRFGEAPDCFSSGHAFAGLQILQEAVAREGLNRARLREYIATHQFDTMIGSIRFAGGENDSLPGTIGQWQSGEFEIVWPRDRATAPIVFPKPRWSGSATMRQG